MGNPRNIDSKKRVALVLTSLGQVKAQAAMLIAIGVEIACDPIPCQYVRSYSKPFEPIIIKTPKLTYREITPFFKKPLTQQTIDMLDNAEKAQLEFVSHEHAILQTVFRKYSAEHDGDRRSILIQKKYLKKLISETPKLIDKTNIAWRNLINYIRKNKLEIKPITFEIIQKTNQKIWKKGFPPLEYTIMKKFGLSDNEIILLKAILYSAAFHESKIRIIDMYKEIIQINRKTEVCSCSCLSPK